MIFNVFLLANQVLLSYSLVPNLVSLGPLTLGSLTSPHLSLFLSPLVFLRFVFYLIFILSLVISLLFLVYSLLVLSLSLYLPCLCHPMFFLPLVLLRFLFSLFLILISEVERFPWIHFCLVLSFLFACLSLFIRFCLSLSIDTSFICHF